MPKFAIIRGDGAIDSVEGTSVQDVAGRYGWPGDGTIEPLDASHQPIRYTFATPEDHHARLNADAAAQTERELADHAAREAGRALSFDRAAPSQDASDPTDEGKV